MRGSGKTTKQIENAPRDAVFVWVNEHLQYANDIAFMLGRIDIEVVGPSWLRGNEWRGRIFPLVVDHAFTTVPERRTDSGLRNLAEVRHYLEVHEVQKSGVTEPYWALSPPRLVGGFIETEAIYTAKLAGVWKPFQAFGRRPSKSIWHASRLAETFAVHFGGVLIDDIPGGAS